MSDVETIIDNTRAIRWWVDEQIRRGRSDEEIERALPLAAGFITGRVSCADLQSLAYEAGP